jgi:hypothetical protein
MAGSFTSPSGASPKMKVGKVNRPKRTSPTGPGMAPTPEYPITDSFASDSIPSFATRRANTNNKSGFNVIPARSPAGRLSNRAETPVSRGSGKVVGRNESGHDANSRGSGGTQKK